MKNVVALKTLSLQYLSHGVEYGVSLGVLCRVDRLWIWGKHHFALRRCHPKSHPDFIYWLAPRKRILPVRGEGRSGGTSKSSLFSILANSPDNYVSVGHCANKHVDLSLAIFDLQ